MSNNTGAGIPTPEDITKYVLNTVEKNKECLIAQFFKKHPNTKPENIELRHTTFVNEKGLMTFKIWIHKIKK